VDTEHKVRSHA